MNATKWIQTNACALTGQTVAITGSTGGLGRALCRHLAALGASLLLLDRNAARSAAHAEALRAEFGIAVHCIPIDMEVCSTFYQDTSDILLLRLQDAS